MSMTNPFEKLAGGGLEDFQPKPASSRTPENLKPTRGELEHVGEQEGFVIDNLPIKRKSLQSGRKDSTEKAVAMSVRFRVSDWNRFVEFCKENRFTVAEGFAKLVDGLESAS